MKQLFYFLIVIVCLSHHSLWGQLTSTKTSILIKHSPEKILIENVSDRSVVNFDFIIENTSNDTLELSRVKVSLFDAKGLLLQERFLDNNGTAPSIKTIPNRIWNGQSKELIFNPFPSFNILMPAQVMAFEFMFEDNAGGEYITNYKVTPVRYEQKISLVLPIRERFLVYDAHDFHAHHRRFNYEFPLIKQLGFNGNFMRYAYDFVVVNEGGKQNINNGKENTDWFSFGTPVIAAAAGKVVVSVDTYLDNKKFDVPALKTNPLALYGNCIVIEHESGLYSVYGHLKSKSLAVKAGDIVKQGQIIGAIGTSGSSFFPHLHFEMRNSINHSAEGIPSYFTNFSVLQGNKKQVVKYGTIDTGDIVQSMK